MNPEELFLAERNIPYNIPLTCTEPDHCCSGKHERLMKAFGEAGLDCRYRVCWFRWSDLALPPEVAAVRHENDCTHVYLEVNFGNHWKIVDATWDPGLGSVFTINDWTDQDMVVAVPSVKTLSPEESAEFMAKLTPHDTEVDLEKHHDFYRALNDWFAAVRTKNKNL